MDGVDPTSELAALIREQVSALRRPAGDETAGSRPPAPHQLPGEDFAMTIAKRIQAIPAADPYRESKVLRLFLEGVLLAELGESLADDPLFDKMVDHVHQKMESDPEFAGASAAAARLLLGSTASRLN